MNRALLKNIYSVVKSICPPVLFPILIKLAVLVKFFVQENRRALVKTNKDLLNVAEGRDAFIIATGPSLKGVNLDFLSGKDCFSVSNFFLHPQLGIVQPRIHFIAPYHPPLVLSEYVDWLTAADQQLPKGTAICLGTQTAELVKIYNLFKSRKVYYLLLEKELLDNSLDICKPVLSPQTSPIMIMPILSYMGYKRVFLLGCDHNILRDYGGTVSNFYPAAQDSRNNATSGENWRDGIIKHLGYALNVFRQYKKYKEIFDYRGIELFNVSTESWLDFYPKITLDDCKNMLGKS